MLALFYLLMMRQGEVSIMPSNLLTYVGHPLAYQGSLLTYGGA